MADAPTNQTVTWQVIGQTEATLPSPMGPLTKGFNVTFQTNTGLSGSVFVPEQQYNEDLIRNLIAQKVAAMTRVQNLSGGVAQS